MVESTKNYFSYTIEDVKSGAVKNVNFTNEDMPNNEHGFYENFDDVYKLLKDLFGTIYVFELEYIDTTEE